MTNELTEAELCEWAVKELFEWFAEGHWLHWRDANLEEGWFLTGDGMLAVKEAMRERGWESRTIIWGGGICSAKFSKSDDVGCGQAHTEPLAVLRAARAALKQCLECARVTDKLPCCGHPEETHFPNSKGKRRCALCSDWGVNKHD